MAVDVDYLDFLLARDRQSNLTIGFGVIREGAVHNGRTPRPLDIMIQD